MSIQKISAIAAAALFSCGIWAWAWAQAQQSRHAPPAGAVVAVPAQPANAVGVGAPRPAASAAVVAAAGPSQPACDPVPVRAKRHTPLKKVVHKTYLPEPYQPPVAVVTPPPPPLPVYSQPMMVVSSPIVVSGALSYGYRGYSTGNWGYYNPHARRYWGRYR